MQDIPFIQASTSCHLLALDYAYHMHPIIHNPIPMHSLPLLVTVRKRVKAQLPAGNKWQWHIINDSNNNGKYIHSNSKEMGNHLDQRSPQHSNVKSATAP